MVGMLPLYWAPFETGVVFVKLFAMIIFLGVLHAFVLLPLLLASFGPDGIDPTGVHSSEGGPGSAQFGESIGSEGAVGGSSSSPLEFEMGNAKTSKDEE